jgi:SAM-dependent methyltransferase
MTELQHPYDTLAPAYDVLTSGHAHDDWLIAIERLAAGHGLRGRRLLDVACGTGKSFAPLLRRGYDVTACDASPGMVERARARAGTGADVRVADMRALPVLGAFDLVTCLDDAICHLLEPAEVLAALRGMRANLAPGGLIAFDVNLMTAYATAADTVVEGEGHVVLWRGGGARLERPGGTAQLVVDLFTARDDGLWSRHRMQQAHRHWPVAEIRRLAGDAGLRVAALCGQRAGGVLAPAVDEARDRKALFLLARA